MNSIKKLAQITQLTLSFVFISGALQAQSIGAVRSDGSNRSNINTAVPFLLISPYAKAGAMGNAGVALISADANAPAFNMSSLAFLPEKTGGLSLSYSPWLKKIAPNINLSFLSGYYRINSSNTISTTLRYFSLGKIEFKDNNIQNIGAFNPNELALDFNYARSFGPNLAMGSGVRYIYSNLYSGQFANGNNAQAGSAVAMDFSATYKIDALLFGKNALLSTGLCISNLGTKINYGGNESYFLPGNIKLGVAAQFFSEQDSHFVFAFDLNKLLAPTEPIYQGDEINNDAKTREKSVTAGILGSFSDAPNGVTEELKEISISTGVEFSYQQKVAFRAGYNYQHPEKGGRSYFTVGAGFNYDSITFDFAYLIGDTRQSPLANTLRFSLQAHFGSIK